MGKRSRRGYRREKSKRGWGPRCTKVGDCHGSTLARGEKRQIFLTAVRVEGAVSSSRLLADSCGWG